MGTLFYKLFQIVLFALGLTFFIGCGLTMMSGGDSTQAWLLFGLSFCVFLIACFNADRHRQVHAVQHVASYDRYVPVAVERPVMMYKGEPYDFVHNNPCAADQAPASPATR